MKVTDFLKKTGAFLLAGVKDAFMPSNLISNIVAEGVIELGEEVIDHFRDKWFEHKLYRSAEKRFTALSRKYNATLLDGLYRDVCAVEGVKPSKLSQGKAYAKLILSSMESITAETVAEFPSVKALQRSDVTEVVTALTELKELICEGFLQSMSAKEQAFVQVVAAKVAKEIGGTLTDAVASVGKSFYGAEFRPVTECPNCGSTDGFVCDEKRLISTCTHCEHTFYCGEKTDLAFGFEQAMRGGLDEMKKELALLSEGVSKILVKLDEKQLNARNLLASEAGKEYPNYELVKHYAEELRLLAPDDKMAEYFICAHIGTGTETGRFLETAIMDGVSEEHKALIARYAIGSVVRPNEVSCVRVFIKNNFANNSELYRTLHHKLDCEAEKVDERIYDVELERDAFIMYKSEDLALVRELVEELEKRGLKCFYSERNLQHIHRKGNNRYNNKIATAMEHCHSFVFVSTEHSRRVDGGHIDEMKGWMKRELDEAKAAIMQSHGRTISSYSEVPESMKKPRIEYYCGRRTGACNEYVRQFFGDRVNGGTTVDEVAAFVAGSAPAVSAFTEKAPAPKTVSPSSVPPQKDEKTDKKAEKKRLKAEKKALKKAEKELAKARKEIAAAERKKEKEEKRSGIKQEVSAPPPLSEDEFGDYVPPKSGLKKVLTVIFFPFILICRLIAWAYTELGNLKRYLYNKMSESAIKNCFGASPYWWIAMTVVNLVGMGAWLAYICLEPIVFGTLSGTLWIIFTVILVGLLIFGMFVISARRDVFKPVRRMQGAYAYEQADKIRESFDMSVDEYYENIEGSHPLVQGARTAGGIMAFVGVVYVIVIAILALRNFFFLPKTGVIFITSFMLGLGIIAAIVYAFAVKGGIRASAFVMTFAMLCATLMITTSTATYSKCTYDDFDGVVDFNYAYLINEDGTASVFLTSGTENVVFPETVDGMTVTAAYTYGSIGAKKVKSVTLPATVTSLAGFSFEQFENIETLELLGVEVLGNTHALSGKAKLRSVSLPLATFIGEGTFKDCVALESISAPSVTLIAQNAFSGCSALKTVDIPNVESIFGGAFSGCSSLESVSIPNAKLVLMESFKDCIALKSMELPSVATIGEGAFRGCTALERVYVPSEVFVIEKYAFDGCTNLTVYGVKSGLDNIWDENWDKNSDGTQAVKEVVYGYTAE